ncbi:MAG TPA: hydrogenase iron-sulfur subunit, partial [Desulfosarcina sp.]|nr:hydrogenase iron-sulfur subunit [Desulfosarcina sp.]
ILGCPAGSCHYKSGNLHALKRVALLQETLAAMGIARERIHIDWVGAGEGAKLAEVVSGMTDRLKRLAPGTPP